MITRAEELILLAVWRLQDEAYSVRIRGYLKELTGKTWSFGAVYMPLDRMAKRGLVRTHLADPTPERGGRSKRIYMLTRSGLKALTEIKQLERAAWEGLSELIPEQE